MENKTSRNIDKNIEKNIVVSINGKEANKIPLADAIKRWSIIDIVTIESIKDPVVRKAKELFVCINGKNVIPKDVMNMNIEDVKTIDILDRVPRAI